MRNILRLKPVEIIPIIATSKLGYTMSIIVFVRPQKLIHSMSTDHITSSNKPQKSESFKISMNPY